MSAATSLGHGLHADGRVHLRLVSDSEMRVARACLRRHHYQYRKLRRALAKSEALRFGSLWHIGQEAWWRAGAGGPEVRLEAAITAMRAHEDVDPFQLVMAEELMVAYTARWGDVPFHVIAVERQFEMPLINPETSAPSRTWKRGGKIDVIVSDPEQCRILIVEHKTTASDIEQGSSYWKRVRALDTQVSTYLAGARSLGHHPEACLYDVVRKPALRPLKATPEADRKYTKKGFLYASQRETDETAEEYRIRLRDDINERPERYLARGEIVRLDEEEREHAFDVWQMTKLLREAENAGFAPRNPDACTSFGGCPYLPVCEGEASIDDDARFYTASTPHEELDA